MHFSYERYLENRIRQEYGFVGTPIILAVKERRPMKLILAFIAAYVLGSIPFGLIISNYGLKSIFVIMAVVTLV